MLVLDASVVVPACRVEDGLRVLGDDELVAPHRMWSEARSVLHEAGWRREIDLQSALEAHTRLESAPIRAKTPARLGREAWRLADELGWARTYDAEYVALAFLLGCRLVTLDGRLRRGADRLGFVVSPAEL
ncbi:MAG: type II toxin-antitoxin system VapC family toxin [Gaiella sp.]|nr:type II toxin-antitoxin system VapC family toxin [Gaiella sp.]